MYIDKLEDIVDKNSNTYNIAIKIMMLIWVHVLTLKLKITIKILSLKLVIMSEYENLKIFLQSASLQIGQKKSLSLRKNTLMEKNFLEHFMKKIAKDKLNGV